MKYCKKCDNEKPKTEFYKDKSRKDGLQYACKSCHLARYADNAGMILQQQRAYQSANIDKITKRQREYQSANTEKLAEKRRAWRKANPDQSLAHDRNRRARKRAAEGNHAAADVKAIFESQRGLCANCTNKLFKSGEKKFHVDHIQPLSRGGSNWPSNLQLLCPDCNLRKHAKDPFDWAKEQGRLL